MNQAKKVLIIAIDFPPHSSVGRHRTVRFARNLCRFGWSPVVLTRTATYMWDRDPETLKEVPENVLVFRAFYPDFVQIVASLFSKNGRGRDTQQLSEEKLKKDKTESGLFKSLIIRFINSYTRFNRRYVLIPDEYIVWVPFAVLQALKIIRSEKIDIIFTTAPPHSLAIVGMILKLITGKPWVTDYRDLWTGDHTRMWINKTRTKLEEIIERSVVSKADRVISVSASKVEALRGKLPRLAGNRFHLITNGFDSENFPQPQDEYKERGKFTITFTGRLYKKITGVYFFRALGELLKERPLLRDYIKVRFIGNITKDEEERLSPILQEYNLSSVASFMPYVIHKEALRYQVDSDLLILFVGISNNSDGIIPTKLFEYFGAGRPILAMVPKGVTWDLVNESMTGIAVEPDDIQGIKDAVWTFFQRYDKKRLNLQPNREVIRQFEGKALTEKLASVLNKVA